jgi:hypothetical protein
MHRFVTTRGHWLTSRSRLLLGVALVASCAQTLATSGKVSVTATFLGNDPVFHAIETVLRAQSAAGRPDVFSCFAED